MCVSYTRRRARRRACVLVPHTSFEKRGRRALYYDASLVLDFISSLGVQFNNKYGGDIIFRISKASNGELVALAKSGFVFFHFATGKVRPMPEDFRLRFPGVNSIEPESSET